MKLGLLIPFLKSRTVFRIIDHKFWSEADLSSFELTAHILAHPHAVALTLFSLRGVEIRYNESGIFVKCKCTKKQAPDEVGLR